MIKPACYTGFDVQTIIITQVTMIKPHHCYTGRIRAQTIVITQVIWCLNIRHGYTDYGAPTIIVTQVRMIKPA